MPPPTASDRTAKPGDSPAWIPFGSRNTASVFWTLMRQVTVVAGATHLLFIALFHALGSPTLVWVNVGSLLLFALSHLCLQRRWNLPATALIVGEILGHAALATRAIGWDSGFHHYLLLVIPVAVISKVNLPYFKGVLLGVVCVLYLVMDQHIRYLPPLDPIPPNTLDVIRGVNIAVTFLLLTYLSALHLKLVMRAEAQLRELATTDPLTHLLNRRSLLEQAQQVSSVDTPVIAFVLADVDHFKSINDRHGHAVGDEALRAISEVLRQAVRSHDRVARWGGEEFLIMMPGATLESARAVAERLREQVGQLELPLGPHGTLRLSMTFGVSLHQPKRDALDASISRADMALYAGKTAGRNRVSVAEGDSGAAPS